MYPGKMAYCQQNDLAMFSICLSLEFPKSTDWKIIIIASHLMTESFTSHLKDKSESSQIIIDSQLWTNFPKLNVLGNEDYYYFNKGLQNKC